MLLAQKFVTKLVQAYKTSLSWLLSVKARGAGFLLLNILLLFIAMIFVFPGIPKDTLPTPSSDRLVVFFRNSAVTDTQIILRDYLPDINAKLRSVLGDRIKAVFANISGRFNQVLVDLTSSTLTDEAVLDLQEVFPSEGDWYYNVMPWDPVSLPLPNMADIQFQVTGPDSAVKVKILDEIRLLLTGDEFYRRVFTRPSATAVEELVLEPREATIDNFPPWNVYSLSSLVRRILGGTSSVTMTSGEDEVTVTAVYPSDYIKDKESLESLLVPWKEQFIPLRHWFNFTTLSGVSQIYSEDGVAVYRLIGRAGTDLSDSERTAHELKARQVIQEKVVFPEGYGLVWEDPRVEINDALGTLFTALAFSLILIFIILAFQFNSLFPPLVVLETVPYGLIGVILSLAVFGSTLNLNSLLGTILLGGLVVNNGILILEFFLVRREQLGPAEALVETGGIRLVPILITSLTTLLGMLPLALGGGKVPIFSSPWV